MAVPTVNFKVAWQFGNSGKRVNNRHIFPIVRSNHLFLRKLLAQTLLISNGTLVAGGDNGLQPIIFEALVGAPTYLNG